MDKLVIMSHSVFKSHCSRRHSGQGQPFQTWTHNLRHILTHRMTFKNIVPKQDIPHFQLDSINNTSNGICNFYISCKIFQSQLLQISYMFEKFKLKLG